MKKKTQTRGKPQMKKTYVENFKEVSHEIEFMFSRFSFVDNNYMWKIDRLWKG